MLTLIIEDSQFESGRFRFDSKVTGWFEIFKSAAPAVIPQTILTVQQKLTTVAPFLFYVYYF